MKFTRAELKDMLMQAIMTGMAQDLEKRIDNFLDLIAPQVGEKEPPREITPEIEE